MDVTIKGAGGVVGDNIPTDTQPLVFSDTVDIILNTADGHTTMARAFTPYQDGIVAVVNVNDTVTPMTVKADTKFVGLFKRFNSTGTSGVTTGIMQS